jgi:hypothetical protein
MNNPARVTRSYVLQDAFTFEDMHRHAAEAWGILGGDIADTWRKFNAAYFNDALRPIPLVISQTLPFGKRIGQCSHNPGHYRGGRAITLNLPACGGHLIAETPCCTRWCISSVRTRRESSATPAREIMRLTKLITGKIIWAGPSKVVRQNGKGAASTRLTQKPKNRRCRRRSSLAGHITSSRHQSQLPGQSE